MVLAEQRSSLRNAQKLLAGIRHVWVWALNSWTWYLLRTALRPLYLEITGPRIHVEVQVAHLTLRSAQFLLLVPKTLGSAC